MFIIHSRELRTGCASTGPSSKVCVSTLSSIGSSRSIAAGAMACFFGLFFRRRRLARRCLRLALDDRADARFGARVQLICEFYQSAHRASSLSTLLSTSSTVCVKTLASTADNLGSKGVKPHAQKRKLVVVGIREDDGSHRFFKENAHHQAISLRRKGEKFTEAFREIGERVDEELPVAEIGLQTSAYAACMALKRRAPTRATIDASRCSTCE